MSPVGNGKLWMLEAPLVYESDIISTLEVPAGFIFDGNSLPRLAWVISTPVNFIEAGCVHDFLYRFGHAEGVNRAQADAAYCEALQVLGMSAFRARLRWIALKVFGGRAYQTNKEYA